MNRVVKKFLTFFVIIIIFCITIFSIWFFFFRTNDVILIKKVINNAVELSVKRQGDNVVFNAVAHNNVPKYFADKTEFNFGHGGFSGLLSTSEIIANLGRLKAVVNEIIPKLGTIEVTVSNDKKSAKAYFECKTKEYAHLMNLKYGRITITSAKTRFGSCSSKGNISYSYRLMLYPERAREYVVVHELAHLSEMNHSKRFYSIIEKILPDYKERKKALKE
jgi:hypothetical protein